MWYLRLAAKWTLKISLSQKSAWIFYALALAASLIARLSFSPEGGAVGIVIGVVLHLALGVAYFGKFSHDENQSRLGVVAGLKIMLVAMAMLGATSAAMIIIPNLLLEHTSTY